MKGTIKFRDPFLMAAGLLAVFLLIFITHFLYMRVSGQQMDIMNIWIYTMGAAMVFSLFSTINLLFATDTSRYYYRTIMAFLSLLIVSVLLSTWISSQSILDLDTYRKMVIFVIIAFMVCISVASMIQRLDKWSRNYDRNFLNKDKDEFE